MKKKRTRRANDSAPPVTPATAPPSDAVAATPVVSDSEGHPERQDSGSVPTEVAVAKRPRTARAGKARLTEIVADAAVAVIVAAAGAEPDLVLVEESATHKTEEGRAAQALYDRILAQVHTIETGFIKVAADIAEAYRTRIWEFFGDEPPELFFQNKIGLGIRTILRLKAIHEALDRLPIEERLGAELALAKIGSHKAAVLAPVIGNHEKPLGEWLVIAADPRTTEKTLQAAVSVATGATRQARAGSERDFGQEFLDRTIGGLSPRHQGQARAVWMAYSGWLASQAGRDKPFDPRATFVVMIERAQHEMGEAGIEIAVTA
jgi:hypothetical protein